MQVNNGKGRGIEYEWRGLADQKTKLIGKPLKPTRMESTNGRSAWLAIALILLVALAVYLRS